MTGAKNNYDCTDCDPGYYCNASSGGAPSGKCYAGYYCTGAAKIPTQFSTLPGTAFNILIIKLVFSGHFLTIKLLFSQVTI